MVKTVADLNAEIDSQFPDNHSRSITPATQRTVLKDIVTNIPVTANQVLTDSGTPSPTTFLAGDNTWKPLSSAGAVTAGSIQTTGGTPTSATALYGDNTWKEPTVNVAHITTTSGTPSGTTALFGDGTWKAPAGGGTTTITGGGLGFSFDSRAAASSATIATTGAGGPNWIRTNGYANPGDGGHGLFVRTGTTPAYSNLIWFSSADGQKWTLVVSSEPLRIEQAGGGTSASGATNSAAIDAIHSIFYSNKSGFPSGYTYAGPQIKLGPGTYNFSGPYFIKGASQISGSGSGFIGGYSTNLKFPVNSDGIVVGAAGTNGRLYNPAIYGDFDGRGSVIRDLSIEGGWDGSATTYWQNQTTGQRGYGILAKGVITLENVHVNKFAEHGIFTKGTAGGGGSSVEPAVGTADNTDTSESYVCAHGFANNFTYTTIQSETNGGDGYRDKGADANAGSYINCSATENGGCGFNMLNFLGNWGWGLHSATNGIIQTIEPNSGKIPCAYHVYGDSQFTNLIACYSEGGQPGSVFRGFSMVIGGLHAAGSPNQSGNSNTNYYNGGSNSAHFTPFTTPTLGGDFAVGSANVDGEIFEINGQMFWRNQASRVQIGSFGNPEGLGAFTLSGYSATQGRASALGSGHMLMSSGFWLGGPQINQGFDQRFTGMSDGLPTAGQWARGDMVRMVNPSAGGAWAYVCTTGGDYAGTPPVWKSVGNLAA